MAVEGLRLCPHRSFVPGPRRRPILLVIPISNLFFLVPLEPLIRVHYLTYFTYVIRPGQYYVRVQSVCMRDVSVTHVCSIGRRAGEASPLDGECRSVPPPISISYSNTYFHVTIYSGIMAADWHTFPIRSRFASNVIK